MAPRNKFDPESFDWSSLVKAEKSASLKDDIRGLTIAEKANLVIADFTNGGTLPAKTADQFIVGAVLQSEMLSMVSSDTYDTPSFVVPYTQFAGQILYAGTQGQAVPGAQRSKPTFGQSTMNFFEFRGQVRIDDGVFEQQIERSGLLNTIMGQVNVGVSRDIENAAVNGDTALVSTNTLLTSVNGWLKRQTSYGVTGTGQKLDKEALKALWKRLPVQYRREITKMRFFTFSDAVIDYVDSLANRSSEKADARVTEGETAPKWNTIPVVGVPLFPYTLGSNSDSTKVLLTDPKNLHIGFQRQVKLEQWRDPDAQQTVISVSVKFDTAIAFEPATASHTDVLVTDS